MAQLQATDTVALQLEGVSRALPLLVERESKLDKRFKDMGRAERVSTRNYRITMQTGLPGSVSKVNLDGGNFPRGGHSTYDVGTVTPLAFVVPLEMTLLAKMTGKGEGVSIDDVVTRNINDCITALGRYRDIFLNTDGKGTIANVTGTTGNNQINLASTPFGARSLQRNMEVQIFVGNVSRGSCQIQDVSNELGAAQFIIVDQIPLNTANGDVVRIMGVESGAPIFVNGIPVFHSNSGVGSVIGISRTNSYVVATSVNAAGANVTQPMVRLARNKTRNALGEEGVKGLLVHTHFSQVASWQELGYPQLRYPMQGGKPEGKYDPMIREIEVDGLEVIDSLHADQTRMDFLNPAVWGKVTWSDGPFWFDLEGQKVWPIPANDGSGSLSTAFISYLVDTLQYYVDNMKACSSITSLGVPAGN